MKNREICFLWPKTRKNIFNSSISCCLFHGTGNVNSRAELWADKIIDSSRLNHAVYIVCTWLHIGIFKYIFALFQFSPPNRVWVFRYFLIPILIPKVSKMVFQVNWFTLVKNVFLKNIQFLPFLPFFSSVRYDLSK